MTWVREHECCHRHSRHDLGIPTAAQRPEGQRQQKCQQEETGQAAKLIHGWPHYRRSSSCHEFCSTKPPCECLDGGVHARGARVLMQIGIVQRPVDNKTGKAVDAGLRRAHRRSRRTSSPRPASAATSQPAAASMSSTRAIRSESSIPRVTATCCPCPSMWTAGSSTGIRLAATRVIWSASRSCRASTSFNPVTDAN